MSNVLCIVQARMGSRRLPGKVLMPVGGVPLIEIAWRKACEAFGKDRVVVAIAMEAEALAFYRMLITSGIQTTIPYCDESDVLGRFYYAAASEFLRHDDIIFRYTPDDWRKDVDAMRRVANGESGIPVEIGGEACTFGQLKEWHETVTDPFLREHIGKLITPDPVAPPDDGLPWSIDEESDLIAVNNSLCTERV